jgi:uncharacterized protein (TIGR02246 family)
MTFRDTLQKHLDAIRRRDLPALAETLPPDELVLITAEGRLVRSAREFVARHADWFRSPTWAMDVEPVSVRESADLGVAVLHLDYRDMAADGTPVRQTSYLTLVFAREGERWLMVQDQNTPTRP